MAITGYQYGVGIEVGDMVTLLTEVIDGVEEATMDGEVNIGDGTMDTIGDKRMHLITLSVYT